MTPLTLAAVAIGGALGSVVRFGVAAAMRQAAPAWPWGTLIVNVAGSFAIGLLVAWFAARPVHEAWRLGLITGVLGGFTTFSAFSIETLELAQGGGIGAGAAYVAATLVLCLGACALGLWTAKALLA